MNQFWDIVCSVPWWPIIVGASITTILTVWFFYTDNMIKCVATALPLVAAFFLMIVDSECILPNAKAAFRESFQSAPVPCLVERPDMLREVKAIIKPPPSDDPYNIHIGGYYLIEGVHGCGKTTILQQVIADSGPGILYVSVGSNGDVSSSLYSALKIDVFCNSAWARMFSFLKVPIESCSSEWPGRLDYALEILTKAATEIFFEDKYPPSVIFDNTAHILKRPEGTEMIHLLQDTAKQVSDTRHLIFLFASSESSVPVIMRSRSSKSRLVGSIEISDIADKEAAEYLKCRCPNATKNAITNAVRLVGGRFIDLATVAVEMINQRKTEKVLMRNAWADIIESLEKLPSRINNIMYDIAHSIVESPNGAITVDTYRSLISVLDVEDKELIQMTNLFHITKETGTVTFHSRLIRHCFNAYLSEVTNSTAWEFK